MSSSFTPNLCPPGTNLTLDSIPNKAPINQRHCGIPAIDDFGYIQACCAFDVQRTIVGGNDCYTICSFDVVKSKDMFDISSSSFSLCITRRMAYANGTTDGNLTDAKIALSAKYQCVGDFDQARVKLSGAEGRWLLEHGRGLLALALLTAVVGGVLT